MNDATIDKINKSSALTLELLKEHTPLVAQGKIASEILSSESKIPAAQKRQLLKEKNIGQKSQEILIAAGLPLIKSLALREFRRRKNWNSRIPYEDLLQEAVIGFIRGLASYNPAATKTSSTNYLGQWVTTHIRRKSESQEHDFSIPYEVVQRARRIRAVRSRLINELEREPTDKELLIALNSTQQGANVYYFGKVKIETNNTAKVETLTQKHLEEAYDIGDRLHILQTVTVDTDQNENSYERNGESLTATLQNQDDIIVKELAKIRQAFFNNTFIEMKMGSKQKEIILRHFGLAPFSEPQTPKEITTNTAYNGKFVKDVIIAFLGYMPTKGGIFHKEISKLNPEEIEDLELNWIIPRLGEWKPRTNIVPPPEMLTKS